MKNRAYANIVNCALTLLIVITLISAVFMIFFRMSGFDINICGMHLFKIVSGSMEPTYSEGDYVISVAKKAESLNPGDIIAFVSEEDGTNGEVIVHRVVSVAEDGNFITRGDANPVDDYSTVRADQLVGKVFLRLTFLKYTDKLFSSIGGFVALIVLPLSFMIINEALHLVAAGKKRRDIHIMIIKYGLDPKDERLYGIAERYGEEAVSFIAQNKAANKNIADNPVKGEKTDERQ
jgi:signal peptidase I